MEWNEQKIDDQHDWEATLTCSVRQKQQQQRKLSIDRKKQQLIF